MNTNRRLTLGVAISGISLFAFCSNVFAQQQASQELDLTITVLQEGETPSGFLNRLVLPPLDFLSSVQAPISSTPQLETVEVIENDVTEIVDVATEIGADSIRETISIDGTTNVTVGGDVNVDLGGNSVISLPENIVDILSPSSPLQNTLQDTVDELGGVLDPVVNSVDPTANIVDSLSPTLPTPELDVVSDVVVDTPVDSIVENLAPASSTAIENAVQGIVEEQQVLPLEDIPEPANELPLPLEDISDELREVPLL